MFFFFRTDRFKVTSPDLGEIQKVTIGHDNGGLLPEWNLDNVRTNLNSIFLHIQNVFYRQEVLHDWDCNWSIDVVGCNLNGPREWTR